jgi:hypothetical protein
MRPARNFPTKAPAGSWEQQSCWCSAWTPEHLLSAEVVLRKRVPGVRHVLTGGATTEESACEVRTRFDLELAVALVRCDSTVRG